MRGDEPFIPRAFMDGTEEKRGIRSSSVVVVCLTYWLLDDVRGPILDQREVSPRKRQSDTASTGELPQKASTPSYGFQT